jgi:hypothetical protein
MKKTLRKRETVMSMNATFVQVDTAELSRFQVDPSLVEALFEDRSAVAALPALFGLTKTMQDRVRAAGPQILAGALSKFPPEIRKQLEERLGRSATELAAGAGGDEILKLIEDRQARSAGHSAVCSRRARGSVTRQELARSTLRPVWRSRTRGSTLEPGGHGRRRTR